MKVLYIVTAYPRHPGDVITPWLVETIRRLRAKGVETEVLAPAYRGLDSQVMEGVQIHRFRYAPANWETLTHDQTAPDRVRARPIFLGLVPSYVAAGALAAARLARTGEFDVVHTFWPIPHGVIGAIAKSVSGVPLVSTFFGVELRWIRSDLPFLRPVLRRIVRASDAVTAISSYTAAELRDLAPGAHPAIVPFGATVETRQRDPLPYHTADGFFEILFAGRLVERKGVRYLIDALHRLPRGRAVRLRILGDGPLRSELEEHATQLGLKDKVIFEGFVPTETLAQRFASCDAFVLPATVDAKGDTEGLGVVLIEALLYGKPVIASDAGGIRDIVIDGRTGLLVPPADPIALASAIEKYMDDPALASRLASAGKAHVEREFSWDAITDQLRALYASVSRRMPVHCALDT